MLNKNVGKIAGALGLVLVLSSWYTFFVTSGSPVHTFGKLGAGAGLIVYFFVTNWGSFGQFATRRSTSYVLMTAVSAVLLVASLVAVNYVAWKKNQSWDLTDKKIYSLAQQTRDTLGGLKQKVEAIAFIPTTHPHYDALQGLLDRYRREAPEKFGYVFKDPKKNPDLAAKYELKEGQTTVVLVRGEAQDQSHTSLSVVSEEALTNALIKLNAVGEQKVYFVAGHGEWPLDGTLLAPDEQGASLTELSTSLRQEGYVTESLNLAGKTEIPRDAALVVVAGARTRLTHPEEALLEKYLDEGGRLLVFAEASADGGLDKLLGRYGIQVDEAILADVRFAVQSPYNLVSLFYGEHEITDMLKKLQLNVQLPTVRGLTLLREGLLSGATVKPIVLSSPFAWAESTPNEHPEPNDGEKTGQIPMVAASTRGTTSAANKRFEEARVVVFGDSELLVDANWGVEPNRNLVMNAFGWATNQQNKITIRPPDRNISTLDLDPDKLASIRFAATDLVPMLLLGLGIAIWQVRRNQ